MKLKTSIHLWNLIAIALILLMAAACSGTGLEKQILGQWQNANTDQGSDLRYSFREDGTVLVWTDEIVVGGTYLWLDDDTIQLTITGGDASQEIVGDVQIEGDRMMISSQDGEVQILARIK